MCCVSQKDSLFQLFTSLNCQLLIMTTRYSRYQMIAIIIGGLYS